MAQVDLINEEAAAELMMSGGQSGGGGGSDKLLEYILENATLVATCKHTTEYTIKYYQGVISKQDPNLNLFSRELMTDDYRHSYNDRLTYRPVGEFSDDYTKQYGTMSFLNMAEIEDYLTYFSRVLFRNDKPLYGDADFIYLVGYRTSFQIIPIYSSLFHPSVVKEYVAFVDYRYIPQTSSYIGDYTSKIENKISISHNNIVDVDIEHISRNKKCYDNDGNVVSDQKILDVPIEYIGYTIDYDKVEVEDDEGNIREIADVTKRPTVSEISRGKQSYTYTFYMNDLPTPSLIGNLTMSELNDIFYDYEYKRYAESVPQSYMDNAVITPILPYPSESDVSE